MTVKTFSVDIDNPSELKKLISKLQKIRKNKLRNMGYHQANFHGCKWNFDDLFPILLEIYNTNLDMIYEKNENENEYIYFHCYADRKLSAIRDIREAFLAIQFKLEYVPFYVGKGIGNRYLDFNRNDSHRKIRSYLKKKNLDIIAVKIPSNNACADEAKLIDILGLKHLSKFGMLVNLDEGFDAENRRSKYSNNSKIKHILKMNGFYHK